jgi:hypothetical protein
MIILILMSNTVMGMRRLVARENKIISDLAYHVMHKLLNSSCSGTLVFQMHGVAANGSYPHGAGQRQR